MAKELRVLLMIALAGVFFIRYANELSTIGKIGWAIFIGICIKMAWKNNK